MKAIKNNKNDIVLAIEKCLHKFDILKNIYPLSKLEENNKLAKQYEFQEDKIEDKNLVLFNVLKQEIDFCKTVLSKANYDLNFPKMASFILYEMSLLLSSESNNITNKNIDEMINYICSTIVESTYQTEGDSCYNLRNFMQFVMSGKIKILLKDIKESKLILDEISKNDIIATFFLLKLNVEVINKLDKKIYDSFYTISHAIRGLIYVCSLSDYKLCFGYSLGKEKDRKDRAKGGSSSYQYNRQLEKITEQICIKLLSKKSILSARQLAIFASGILEKEHLNELKKFPAYSNNVSWTEVGSTFYNWCNKVYKEYKTNKSNKCIS